MKKLLIAFTAIAAFTAPAFAADIAKAPLRAAPVAYAPSWTGCYVGGGGGYGLFNQENTQYEDTLVGTFKVHDTATTGGRGWFGTIQGGCDYQFGVGSHNLVIGAFGDYDWSNIEGKHSSALFQIVGDEKISSAWSVGGRIGWVVTPNLLTYFSAGYTEATFDRQNFVRLGGPPFGIPSALFLDKRTSKGWFLGAGDEYALNFVPGLFWKTEYRFSEFDLETNRYRFVATGAPGVFFDQSKKFLHTVRSELVYRFNWGGPVVAKY